MGPLAILYQVKGFSSSLFYHPVDLHLFQRQIDKGVFFGGRWTPFGTCDDGTRLDLHYPPAIFEEERDQDEIFLLVFRGNQYIREDDDDSVRIKWNEFETYARSCVYLLLSTFLSSEKYPPLSFSFTSACASLMCHLQTPQSSSVVPGIGHEFPSAHPPPTHTPPSSPTSWVSDSCRLDKGLITPWICQALTSPASVSD